ncbi:hypothetical protein [Streptomyces sp. AcE210]|nr:hypothetical protein [Streptomyces sp. AcE210]
MSVATVAHLDLNVGIGLPSVCLTAQSSRVVTENCNGSTAQKWVLRAP